MSTDGLRRARAVADAVLYEGYLLYPYRASAAKNRLRWQFGVLGPVGAAVCGNGEESTMRAECLLAGDATADVRLRVRFLQLQTRSVQRLVPGSESDPIFEPVSELNSGDREWISWDEAVDREVDLGEWSVSDLLDGPVALPVAVEGSERIDPLHDSTGEVVGRIVRTRWPLSAQVALAGSVSSGEEAVVKISATLANQQQWYPEPGHVESSVARALSSRDRALRHSLISAHLVFSTVRARFVSMIDPPESAWQPAQECTNHRLWPVLAGQKADHQVVLAAPLILYDWPEIAAQSTGEFFDSTEIDELLSLRVMTLTDAEKREARATDQHAAEIVDRCEKMTGDALDQLHGAIEDLSTTVVDGKSSEGMASIPVWATPSAETDPGSEGTNRQPWWDPGVDGRVDPATDTVDVSGVAVRAGATVRLCPGGQADAQDLFFAGQVATVTGVYHDVDGQVHLAVLLRDDPASELHEWYGRYLYFRPDEVAPTRDEPVRAES